MLKPEGREEYIRLHKKIPQKVAALIRACNLRNYSIFFKDNMLFAYYEYVGSDYEADMKKMADNADNQRWWDTVKPLMIPLDAREPGEFWCGMQEIFFQA